MKYFQAILALGSVLALAVSPARATSGVANDYDGDGKADVSVYDPAAGNWYISRSGSNNALRKVGWGYSETRPVLGDFDGDGRADVAVFNRQSGVWSIQQSSNGQLRKQTFGFSDSRPVPADYDGDGKTDLAVYQHISGDWYILRSGSGSTWHTNFGWSETRPVPADYDGDGKADLAVFHRQTGNWYIRNSQSGSVVQRNWGHSQTRPVPADYDGDGKADVAVYQLSSGNWYIRQSSNGALRKQNWGWFEARAVPSDYDGDGKADIAVFARKTGKWYIQLSGSANALRTQVWGWSQTGAIPSYRDGGIQGLVILAYGDSITYGTASSSNGPETGYPLLLERIAEPALGGHCVTINGGNPGEKTSDGLQRLPIWLNLFKPDLTLLMEGTNDEFFSVPFSQTDQNLRNMILLARSAGSAVILGTIPPVISTSERNRSGQEQRIEGFNPRIYQIGADLNVPIARVFESITAVPNWQNLLIDQSTANHPNDAGYKVVRDAFNVPLTAGTLNGTFY